MNLQDNDVYNKGLATVEQIYTQKFTVFWCFATYQPTLRLYFHSHHSAASLLPFDKHKFSN
ncbi:MAG: hypothetical protein RSB92_04640 [Chryseobacterium sp.]